VGVLRTREWCTGRTGHWLAECVVEPSGLKLAGTLVPFAYIGWSVWLLALGISLMLTA
jgi:hypothetical protein